MTIMKTMIIINDDNANNNSDENINNTGIEDQDDDQ